MLHYVTIAASFSVRWKNGTRYQVVAPGCYFCECESLQETSGQVLADMGITTMA